MPNATPPVERNALPITSFGFDGSVDCAFACLSESTRFQNPLDVSFAETYKDVQKILKVARENSQRAMSFYSKVYRILLKFNVIFTQIVLRAPLLSYVS